MISNEPIKRDILKKMRLDSTLTNDALVNELKNSFPDSRIESIKDQVTKVNEIYVQRKVGIVNPRVLLGKNIYPYFIFVVADDYRKFRNFIEEKMSGNWFSLYGYDDYLCKIYCSPNFFEEKMIPEIEKYGTVSYFRGDDVYVEHGFDVPKNFKTPDSKDEEYISLLQSDCSSVVVSKEIKDRLLKQSTIIGYGIIENYINTGGILAVVGVEMLRGMSITHLRKLVSRLMSKSGKMRKYIAGLYEGRGKIKDYDLLIVLLLRNYYDLNMVTEYLYNLRGITVETYTHPIAEPIKAEIPQLEKLHYFEEIPEDFSTWANKMLKKIYDSLPPESHPTLRAMAEKGKSQLIAGFTLLSSSYSDRVSKPRNMEYCETAVKQFLNGVVTKKGLYFDHAITNLAKALEEELYDLIKLNGEIALGPDWELQLKKELSQREDKRFSLGSYIKIIEHWKRNYRYCPLGIAGSEYQRLNDVNKHRKSSVHGTPLAKVEKVSDEQIEEYHFFLYDTIKLLATIERVNIEQRQTENRLQKLASVTSSILRRISEDERNKLIPALEDVQSEIGKQKLTEKQIIERLKELAELLPEKDRPLFKRFSKFLGSAVSAGALQEIIGMIIRAILEG